MAFAPGRNCHDAIKAILISVQKRSKYVLDADIRKCFDKISHSALLEKLGYSGGIREQIKQWLECGILDENVFSRTEEGAPQGGVISPLLANIALHGMETRIKDFVQTIPDVYPSGGPVNIRDRRASVSLIRYADDFVIMHHNKETVLACKEIITQFLDELGLSLSAEKTRVTHTLKLSAEETIEFDRDKPGFNFLGFTIRQFHSKYKSAHNGQGVPLGYRTLVVPSKEKIQKHMNAIKAIIHRGRNLSQKDLILKLNKVVTGWARYFALSDASSQSILQQLDFLMYLKLRKWGKATHKGSSKAASKLWQPIGSRKWVFGPVSGPFLKSYLEHADSIQEYVKVKGEASPYDGEDMYWATRKGQAPGVSKSVAKLLKAQKGRCSWCKLFFEEGDVLETDHIIPKSLGGPDKYDNLQLLHRHCHDEKTRIDGSLKNKEAS